VLTIVSFIFVLGVLIFFHELGHFVVAKRAGVKVERFSLGFPPNIFSRRWGETTYSIGLIPLGGYVKMAGEQPDEEATGSPDEFMSKSVGQRTAVILAGPLMNYFLALFILIGIYYFSGSPYYDDSRVLVGVVDSEGPAGKAGLQTDDQIIAVNQVPISTFDSLQAMIHRAVETEVSVSWLRGTDTLSSTMITRRAPALSAEGEIDTVGEIGITQKPVGYNKYGLLESVANGVEHTHLIAWETLKFLKQLVTGQVSSKLLGGPLFIARQSGKEARHGIASLLIFMALLSINLAILNVLPIPVLDGGHLVFLIIEKLRGRPPSMKARMIAQQVGMLALLTLIVFVTYNDILRMIGGL
jgi:regulator of sigma E protease